MGGVEVDPILEKDGFQFQTAQVMNGKTRVPREEKTLVGCSENPMILILMRVSLSRKLRKTNKNKQKKRGRVLHMRTYTHTRTCMQNCSSMVGYSEGTGGSRRG